MKDQTNFMWYYSIRYWLILKLTQQFSKPENSSFHPSTALYKMLRKSPPSQKKQREKKYRNATARPTLTCPFYTGDAGPANPRHHSRQKT
jgi:hypothetical protein